MSAYFNNGLFLTQRITGIQHSVIEPFAKPGKIEFAVSGKANCASGGGGNGAEKMQKGLQDTADTRQAGCPTRPIVINGTVLCDPITGIPRYVYEVVTRLDALLEDSGLDVRLVYRDDGRKLNLPPLKNITVVPLKAVKFSFNLFVLPRYLARNHAFLVGLASDLTLTHNSVVVLHDIRPYVMKLDGTFYRFKFWMHCIGIRRFAEKVFTVSENQKDLIAKELHIPPKKIGVTYNGWEHMNGIDADDEVFQKNPAVVRGQYFYALGSLAKHKNYKWIREVARRNPDKIFVVAGGADLKAFGKEKNAVNRSNVIFMGRVTDEENKALMQHCKAFLHPAIFEGFAIPPLEALSQGARILVSNASCLPEIFMDCAVYFDPYNYDVDLDALLARPVASPQKLLEKYSWDKTAEFWREEIAGYAGSRS